ncbi:MAG: patatin-like phospholipase family protein [Fimbriimonadaceae bacterium]|nr:patatin-like phospholipase family protein [Fimbriimonadaceae bacterium]
MRLLAIDGGGMLGVYACAYLKALEEHFGKRIQDHFDLVAGTSTGGIIALGLGANKSPAEILDFYRTYGSEIFPMAKPYSRWKVLKLWRMFCDGRRRLDQGYWYDSAPLLAALKTVLSDADGRELKLQDSIIRLLIPAVNAQNCEPRVFKVRFEEAEVEHLNRDPEISMIEVAMATSAAPWYLPMAMVDEKGTKYTYIDGGLWANNPSLAAVIEALHYYVGEKRGFQSVGLLSIGLPSCAGFSNDGAYQRGVQFVPQLLSYAMESNKLGAHYGASFLLDGQDDLYHRVKPGNLTSDQARRLRLDSSDSDAIEELVMLGDHKAQNDKNLQVIKDLFT